MNIKDINSHSNKNRILADAIKLKTRNNTEYIEFWTTIIINALINSTLEKK